MNKNGPVPERCPICGARVSNGHTTFAVDLGFGVVVVRHVPAHLCPACGESWLDDLTAKSLERIVENARAQRHEVEVLAYSS